MKKTNGNILIINGGSSSIKFALYKLAEPLVELFSGTLENIGTQNLTISFIDAVTKQKTSSAIILDENENAIKKLIEWLEKQDGFADINAIGHRIVYGLEHTEPIIINNELLDELKKINNYDPEHLPEEINLIEAFTERFPQAMQIACFDTSFHASMPAVAKMLPIPRRYYAKGIQRYGFHGLSYAYLLKELNHLAGNEVANGKLILAHLGSGASLAAVKNGKSVDTTMGFTPTAGLPMGTRTGDLDPGVAWYLMQTEKLSPEQFNHLINHESGLLGISETSADTRELIKSQGFDKRAADAIEFFCYQTKKWIGAFTAVLGGVDTLVFSGGIGENSPEIRSRICHGLQFLGIEVDETKNGNNEAIISTDLSSVVVRVIKTNEELMIAKAVSQLLNS